MDISPIEKVFHGKNDDSIDQLGEDLLLEILSRVSVKSLLMCRSVSKTWYALTKKHYFVHKHFVNNHHRRRSESHRHHHSIFSTNSTSLFLHPYALFCDEKEKLSNLKSPFLLNELRKLRWCGFSLLGSSNGLVCFCFLYESKDRYADADPDRDEVGEEVKMCQQLVIIWNPATDHYRILPKPVAKICDIPLSKYEKDDITNQQFPVIPLVGFDFINDHDDMITSEYKLARIFSHASTNDNKTTFQAQIFMQNANSWRQVRNELVLEFQLSRRLSDYPITLNGVLYWTMQREGNKRWYVMSFDLRDEVFSLIELPNDEEDKQEEEEEDEEDEEEDEDYEEDEEEEDEDYEEEDEDYEEDEEEEYYGPYGPDLISWRNSLAVVAHNSDEDCYTIWVMSKTEKTFWRPQFKIKDARSKGLDMMMRTTWNDQLLFRCIDKENGPGKYDLFSYDLQTETRRKILSHASIAHRHVNYIESLARV